RRVRRPAAATRAHELVRAALGRGLGSGRRRRLPARALRPLGGVLRRAAPARPAEPVAEPPLGGPAPDPRRRGQRAAGRAAARLAERAAALCEGDPAAAGGRARSDRSLAPRLRLVRGSRPAAERRRRLAAAARPARARARPSPLRRL